jgi:hypothetical protein
MKINVLLIKRFEDILISNGYHFYIKTDRKQSESITIKTTALPGRSPGREVEFTLGRRKKTGGLGLPQAASGSGMISQFSPAREK